jgi:hypothetical protein
MSRLGALEVFAGAVDPKALPDVMANTNAQSKARQRTDAPAQIATAARFGPPQHGTAGSAPRTNAARDSETAGRRLQTGPEGPTRSGRQVYDVLGK